MSADGETGNFFIKRPEVASGRVLLTPDGPQPYKVDFHLGGKILAEHPVPTIREGEALIRRELLGMQFTAHQERPNPEAPIREKLATAD